MKKNTEEGKRQKGAEIFVDEEKENLEFVLAGDRVYRVINKRTNRFHDIEPGIDWMT